MSISITRNFDNTLEPPILQMNPPNQALDYVRLLWPTALCELIATETNRYAFQRHVRDWTPTNEDKIWAFLGTIVLMGYHTLPSFENFSSSKKFSGVPALQERMSYRYFVDCGVISKLWTMKLTTYQSQTSDQSPFKAYDPCQYLLIDETMIKSKGRTKSKVCMPKNQSSMGVLSILFLLWLPMWLPNEFWYVNPV